LKVLIVDNNDSFSYNLKHYVNQFTDDIDVVRGDEINIFTIVDYDKIILSPGPGLPSEHPILEKILEIYHSNKSILGICLGQQAIAEFFNAELENLENVKHGITSEITNFNNCKLFRNLPKNFKIGHYHSWVVSKNNFPEELNITSENEEGIVTSISHNIYDITAVQFHPESILTEHGLELIKNWVLD